MLVSEDGHITKLKFNCNGFDYRIIQTKRGSNHSVWAARDEVLNETLKIKKWFTRKELKEYFKNIENELRKKTA